MAVERAPSKKPVGFSQREQAQQEQASADAVQASLIQRAQTYRTIQAEQAAVGRYVFPNFVPVADLRTLYGSSMPELSQMSDPQVVQYLARLGDTAPSQIDAGDAIRARAGMTARWADGQYYPGGAPTAAPAPRYQEGEAGYGFTPRKGAQNPEQAFNQQRELTTDFSGSLSEQRTYQKRATGDTYVVHKETGTFLPAHQFFGGKPTDIELYDIYSTGEYAPAYIEEKGGERYLTTERPTELKYQTDLYKSKYDPAFEEKQEEQWQTRALQPLQQTTAQKVDWGTPRAKTVVDVKPDWVHEKVAKVTAPFAATDYLTGILSGKTIKQVTTERASKFAETEKTSASFTAGYEMQKLEAKTGILSNLTKVKDKISAEMQSGAVAPAYMTTSYTYKGKELPSAHFTPKGAISVDPIKYRKGTQPSFLTRTWYTYAPTYLPTTFAAEVKTRKFIQDIKGQDYKLTTEVPGFAVGVGAGGVGVLNPATYLSMPAGLFGTVRDPGKAASNIKYSIVSQPGKFAGRIVGSAIVTGGLRAEMKASQLEKLSKAGKVRAHVDLDQKALSYGQEPTRTGTGGFGKVLVNIDDRIYDYKVAPRTMSFTYQAPGSSDDFFTTTTSTGWARLMKDPSGKTGKTFALQTHYSGTKTTLTNMVDYNVVDDTGQTLFLKEFKSGTFTTKAGDLGKPSSLTYTSTTAIDQPLPKEFITRGYGLTHETGRGVGFSYKLRPETMSGREYARFLSGKGDIHYIERSVGTKDALGTYYPQEHFGKPTIWSSADTRSSLQYTPSKGLHYTKSNLETTTTHELTHHYLYTQSPVKLTGHSSQFYKVDYKFRTGGFKDIVEYAPAKITTTTSRTAHLYVPYQKPGLSTLKLSETIDFRKPTVELSAPRGGGLMHLQQQQLTIVPTKTITKDIGAQLISKAKTHEIISATKGGALIGLSLGGAQELKTKQVPSLTQKLGGLTGQRKKITPVTTVTPIEGLGSNYIIGSGSSYISGSISEQASKQSSGTLQLQQQLQQTTTPSAPTIFDTPFKPKPTPVPWFEDLDRGRKKKRRRRGLLDTYSEKYNPIATPKQMSSLFWGKGKTYRKQRTTKKSWRKLL